MDKLECYFCKTYVDRQCVSQCDFCYVHVCDNCEIFCLSYQHNDDFDKCIECEKDIDWFRKK